LRLAGLVCPLDREIHQLKKQRVVVPLVVAGCLSVVVIVVIIGYIVSRRTKTGYSNME
jgi:hypothetical protein